MSFSSHVPIDEIRKIYSITQLREVLDLIEIYKAEQRLAHAEQAQMSAMLSPLVDKPMDMTKAFKAIDDAFHAGE